MFLTLIVSLSVASGVFALFADRMREGDGEARLLAVIPEGISCCCAIAVVAMLIWVLVAPPNTEAYDESVLTRHTEQPLKTRP